MKSLMAQGTEQIWSKCPGQEASGHGGRAPISWEISSSVEFTSSARMGLPSRGDSAVGWRPSSVRARVAERVETWCGLPVSSSEVEAEPIVQSWSRSGSGAGGRSLHALRRRAPDRLGREPRVWWEPEGWSGSISGVGERRYSNLRKSEALLVGVRRIGPGILRSK